MSALMNRKFLRVAVSVWLNLGLAALFVLTTSFSLNGLLRQARVRTIVIDAGHGGDDSGAVGAYSKEKNVALKVALALGKAIEEEMPDIKVIYTRTTDVRIDLYERIGIANRQKADLFISLHCNSLPLNVAGRTRYNGVETLLSGSGRLGEQDVALRENASMYFEKDYKTNYADPKDPESAILMGMMKNNFRRQSFAFASLLQSQFRQAGRIDRGIREQSLAVLARAGMPAVLCEIGYICANQDEEYMNSESGQREIVSCIVGGIKAYRQQGEPLAVD
jgi:N-acetylmuramoyl-L-alanine amidase